MKYLQSHRKDGTSQKTNKHLNMLREGSQYNPEPKKSIVFSTQFKNTNICVGLRSSAFAFL